MKVGELLKCCDALISAFAKDIDALDIRMEDTKKQAVWSVYTNMLRFDFVYRKKGNLYCPVSTLFCRIYLQKTSWKFYHLPLLADEFDPQDFHCFYYQKIESEARMKACVKDLTDNLKLRMPALHDLVLDGERFDAFTANYYEQICRICGIKTDEFSDDPIVQNKLWELAEDNILLHFTTNQAYREFLKGNYKKAIPQYRKAADGGVALDCEIRLLELMEQGEQAYQAISEECASLIESQQYDGTGKDALRMLFLFLIMGALCGAIGVSLVVLINAILEAGTTDFIGVPIYCGLLVGGLPAIFGSIAFRRHFAKLLYGKNAQKALDFDDINNSKALNRASVIVFIIATVLSAAFLVVVPAGAVRMYEDKMVYNISSSPFDLTTSNYKDIENIYYIQSRYNDYGERLERPSYVLYFKDGAVFDLDMTASVEQTEQKVLPHFEPYIKKVQKLDSDRELPKN